MNDTCLGGALDIVLPFLGAALLLSCFGNSTYVPWQDDWLERRCEVDIGLKNGLLKELGPKNIALECVL